MFKRYTKNPFENEQSASVYDVENSSGNMHQSHGNVFHAERQNYSQQVSDDYSQEVPPRIFGGHPSQALASGPTSDERLTQQELWGDKAPSLVQEEATTNDMLPEEPETTLGHGVVFRGKMEFKTLLRIDGHFEGELISEGKLVIGPTGVVKSNVKLREAIVEGYIEGNMDVDERIELRGDAQVHGDIQTKFLSVDEGVTIIGSIMVTPNEDRASTTPNTGDSSDNMPRVKDS